MKEYVSRASIQVLVLFISFVISGCGGGGGGDPTGGNTSNATLTAISVTPTNPSIAKGTSRQFTATGIYSDNTTKDMTTTATWSSSSAGVATIGNTGLVSSVNTGATTISASYGAVTGSTTLTVTAAQLVSIDITPVNPSIASGTTNQFAATGVFSDSTTQDLTAQVTWSSSNTGVAAIDSKGFATAVSAGTTTISAAFSSISGSSTLTVTAATLTSISVTPTNPSVAKGTPKQFTATGTFTDGTTQELTGQVVWNSSNTGVASINNGGIATSVAIGSTTITATSGTISGSTTLTVTAATLTSISVTPANPSIALGTTKQFTATGTYTDGSTQNLTASATWISSNTATATISNAAGSYGLATPVAVGITTVTAIDPATGISGATILTVTAAQLVSISVSPANISIPLGATQQFTAIGTYSDNTTQDLTTAVTWSSSNTGSVTISKALRKNAASKVTKAVYLSNASSSKGLATAVAIGTTIITATDSASSINGTASLTVTAATLTSIAITPANPSIAVGTTKQFTATGTYTDGTTQNLTTSVTWSSSNTATATISNAAGSNGLATSVAVGTTTITAIDPATGISGATILTVTAAQLVSISVSPANASIPQGTTQQFTAIGTYTDNTTQDLTPAVTWSSSNTATATISNAGGSNGLATSVAVGTTTITATEPVSSKSGLTSLTVTRTATNVGGIINANTTWTLANSPYTITNFVEIASGVTLTIEPGVIVNSNGSLYIGVWGSLNAIGTQQTKIVFNNVPIIGRESNENGSFLINVQFANILGGYISPSPSPTFGSLILKDSYLYNTSDIIHIWYPTADIYIERNVFNEAFGIYYGVSPNKKAYIRNNVFYKQKGSFAIENFANYDTGSVVQYNSFLSTDRIALRLPCLGSDQIDGINNFWNTTDTSVIDTMIYDKKDTLGACNYINYIPYLTSPHPNTPPFP